MSEAHEAIRNLLGRYCELVDSGDWVALAGFLGDAVLCDEHGTAWASGRDEILAAWRRQTKLYDGSPHTKHLVLNTVIVIGPEDTAATARSSYVVLQATDTVPLQPIITGRYRDSFRCDAAGKWRFTERRYAVDQVGDLAQHLNR